jgi:dihydroorotase
MSVITRRNLLSTAGSFALATAMGGPARAAMGPNDKFDLVIKGGDVLDPSQSLRGKRDIGIRFGLVEAVEADIPAARALRVLDAGGKLVTPGLIDLHAHVFPYGSAIGIPADELVAHQCTTTCVSGGDAGAAIWSKILELSKDATLQFDLFLGPHHCSWTFFSSMRNASFSAVIPDGACTRSVT